MSTTFIQEVSIDQDVCTYLELWQEMERAHIPRLEHRSRLIIHYSILCSTSCIRQDCGLDEDTQRVLGSLLCVLLRSLTLV